MNNNHHHLPQVVVVPAASSIGLSIAVDSSSAQDRPLPWTRFRHRTTTPPSMTDPASSDPHIPPFRGRQAIYHHPGPRFNARAVKFHALRMQLPLRTSHAACARYRLGQKNTIPLSPRREIATADRLDIQLDILYTHLLLLDTTLATHVVPLPTAVIRALSHASSSRCDPASSAYSCDVPPHIPGPQRRPTPPSSPYVPPPPTSTFFGG